MKINLEKQLLKANKKLATPEELLVIREYDNHTDLVDNDALTRVGMADTINEGFAIKAQKQKLKDETKKFNQERIFHISQIEKTCNKYYLRFLPSQLYNGSIDDELPNRIINFEIAYGEDLTNDGYKIYEKMFDRMIKDETFHMYTTLQEIELRHSKTFIMAPKKSFELQEKPKDPLFFYKINDEYYYLIHKWGNDLSIFRRCLNLLSNNWACYFLILAVLLVIMSFVTLKVNLILSLIIIVPLITIGICNIFMDGYDFSLLEKNNWNSHWK